MPGSRQDEIADRIKRNARPGLSRSLTVRLPNELYDRLEDYAGEIGTKLPGYDLTISDVVRNLLEQSLGEKVRTAKRARRDEAIVQELLGRVPAAPKKEEGI
jgi:hypothetical protein